MLDLKNFQSAISQIAEEKGLSAEQVREAIEGALAAAYKKEYRKKAEIVRARFEPRTGKFLFALVKTVIDSEVPEAEGVKANPDRHIALDEAKKVNPDARPGDEVLIDLDWRDDFGRIAAQTAKQVILQKLRETEKTNLYEEFKKKEEQLISGIVQRVEGRTIFVDLGKTMGVMFFKEQIPNEHYRSNQRLRFFVYAVESTSRGVQVFLSRAHPLFLVKLFEMEVPEVVEGLIQIKAVAREPGLRSKIAVASTHEGIDPIGACVGPRGARVIAITNELNNEKIDVIQWEENPENFVARALSPARVIETQVLPRRMMLVLVAEDQLPLAIGKGGQNVRLAARLTGWRIDVRSVERPEEAVEGGLAELGDGEGQEGESDQAVQEIREEVSDGNTVAAEGESAPEVQTQVS